MLVINPDNGGNDGWLDSLYLRYGWQALQKYFRVWFPVHFLEINNRLYALSAVGANEEVVRMESNRHGGMVRNRHGGQIIGLPQCIETELLASGASQTHVSPSFPRGFVLSGRRGRRNRNCSRVAAILEVMRGTYSGSRSL